MADITREEWEKIAKGLAAPFDPKEVDFRVQGTPNKETGRAQVLAYIDARAVQNRLDEVVGVGGWSFDCAALSTDNKGEIVVAKATITIHGVSKSDVGTASNFSPSPGAVSHAEKRAASQWGIGRYLYDLDGPWVQVEKGGKIPAATLARLRAQLPKNNADMSRPAETTEDGAESSAPTTQEPTGKPALTQVQQTVQDIVEASAPAAHSWGDCFTLCKKLGYDEEKSRAESKKYGSAGKFYAALIAEVAKASAIKKEAPGLGRSRTRALATQAGVLADELEKLLEDYGGDLDKVEDALEARVKDKGKQPFDLHDAPVAASAGRS